MPDVPHEPDLIHHVPNISLLSRRESLVAGRRLGCLTGLHYNNAMNAVQKAKNAAAEQEKADPRIGELSAIFRRMIEIEDALRTMAPAARAGFRQEMARLSQQFEAIRLEDRVLPLPALRSWHPPGTSAHR